MRTTVVVVVVSVVGCLPMFLTGALAVHLHDALGLGATRLGMAIALYLGMGACFSIPLGWLTDVVGAERCMRWSCLVSGLAGLGIARATPHWAVLFGWMVLAGISEALGQNAVNNYISSSVPARVQGRMFGLKQASMPAAAVLAGMSVPLLAGTSGWEAIFLLAGVFSVCASLLVPGAAAPKPLVAASRAVPLATPATLPSASFRPVAIRFALAGGLGFGAACTLPIFTVSSAVSSGLSAASAGYLLAVGSALAILGRLASGLLADMSRAPDARPFLRIISLMLGTAVLGFLGLGMTGPTGAVVGVCVAFGFGWAWNGMFFLALSRIPGPRLGAMMSAGLAGTYVGGSLAPLGFSVIVHRYGYSQAWLFAAAMALGAALMMESGSRHVGHAIRSDLSDRTETDRGQTNA